MDYNADVLSSLFPQKRSRSFAATKTGNVALGNRCHIYNDEIWNGNYNYL